MTRHFSKIQSVKAVVQGIFLMTTFSFFSVLGQPLPSHAGTWTDHFSDGVLNGWTQHVKGKRKAADQEWQTTWEIKNNALHLSLQIGPPGPFGVRAHLVDFLHFTAFPLSSSRLTVSIRWIDRRGISRLALGKPGSYYAFTKSKPMAIRTRLDGGGFQTFAGKYPLEEDGSPKSYKDAPLEQIKIVFDSGKFQVFSGDELQMEFIDEQFPEISVAGILAGPTDGSGSDILDNFQISGPDIPNGSGDGMTVTARGKLATTWGQVKRGSIH